MKARKLRRHDNEKAYFFWNPYFAQHKTTSVLNTLFESGSLISAGTTPLLMELGTGYCLLAQLNKQGTEPSFIRLWGFAPAAQEESLVRIMDVVDAAGIARNKIRTALALPQTSMLPDQFSGKADVLLEALFPGFGTEARVFSGSRHYVFAVPRPVNALLHSKFNEVNFLPALALLQAPEEAGNCIQAFFIGSEFRVVVHRNFRLLLQQQYGYVAPLDVVYYLLKICAEFGFTQQNTLLSVSGFITADSALYHELHQYFLNIRFSELDSVNVAGADVPKHYFTSLFNLATCAL